MGACGSAHYWGRQAQTHGHRVVLLPPHVVRPYVLGNKTDRTDAKGLLEAARTDAARPVPVKTETQADRRSKRPAARTEPAEQEWMALSGGGKKRAGGWWWRRDDSKGGSGSTRTVGAVLMNGGSEARPGPGRGRWADEGKRAGARGSAFRRGAQGDLADRGGDREGPGAAAGSPSPRRSSKAWRRWPAVRTG
jgi:hypothetical protein